MLIGFTGLAGCGKSTAAKHLEQQHNWTRARMADPLKNMLRSLYADMGHSGVEIERRIEGALKDSPDGIVGTPRHLMQTLGTEWGRKIIHRDFWVNVAAARILSCKGHVVVEDIRFDNEAKMIRALGGRIIRIVRADHVSAAGDGSHESEKGIWEKYVHDKWYVDGGVSDLQIFADSVAT